jgi:prepilin-type N-terminal cleavage/methylation domain-containing protein
MPHYTQKGFTLIELLAVAMVLSVLTFISLTLFNSGKAREQLRETQVRLELITVKIKQFYKSRGQLPAPVNGNKVPVQSDPDHGVVDSLDMAQKYRLDAWGQYFRYFRANGIADYKVNNREAEAGILISLGPNQIQDYIVDDPVDPTTFTSAPEGDDLLIPVNVTEEAKTTTLYKLKVLQEKVAAYDALFSGIDNDGDGTVDENVGAPALLKPTDDSTCPPTSNLDNDPSEGLSTLDAIENETDAIDYGVDCSATVVEWIVKFFGLPYVDGDIETDPWKRQHGYNWDPWNRQFRWGYENLSDRSYHRFYSSGPDEAINEDDIIFGGE